MIATDAVIADLAKWLDSKRGFAIHREAVLYRGAQLDVYIMRNGATRVRVVTERRGRWSEVLSIPLTATNVVERIDAEITYQNSRGE